MAKKVTGYIKLQIPAGKATPAPPVGPALGQHGVNTYSLPKSWTQEQQIRATWLSQLLSLYMLTEAFSLYCKTPPAAVLLKKACKLKSGSATPNKTKVATISKDEVRKIAELKMPDLNAANVEAAMSMIAGTARSMGITVEE